MHSSSHLSAVPVIVRVIALSVLLSGTALGQAWAEKSLYERLGGYGAISAVVNDFAGKLFTDRQVGEAFSLEIFGHPFAWIRRLEQSPAPAQAPELIALETALGVLDHDEPAFGLGGVADLAGGHGIGLRLEQFLHQHCAVGAFFKGMGTDTRKSFIQKNITLVCNVTSPFPALTKWPGKVK